MTFLKKNIKCLTVIIFSLFMFIALLSINSTISPSAKEMILSANKDSVLHTPVDKELIVDTQFQHYNEKINRYDTRPLISSATIFYIAAI
ncbi:hypothetical protein ACR777_04165 [Sphingobacterium spiritivorum]|uniref:hypothetical protein n=1 Tax=Sphingobacterium spiritivorum TaxID=258 RepID=UPI003DA3BAC1